MMNALLGASIVDKSTQSRRIGPRRKSVRPVSLVGVPGGLLYAESVFLRVAKSTFDCEWEGSGWKRVLGVNA